MGSTNVVPWLRAGTGSAPADGGCVMQIVDWVSRNEWTDAPPCVHPVIRGLAIEVNDRLDDESRQRLLDLVPRMIDTARDGDVALTRRLLGYLARRSYPLYSAWAESSGYDDKGAVLACIEAAEKGEAAGAAQAAWAAQAAQAAWAAQAAQAAGAAQATWAAGAAQAAWAAEAARAARAAEAAWAAEAARAARAAGAAEAAEAARAAWAARAAEAAPDYLGLLVGLLDRYDELVSREVSRVDLAPVCAVLPPRFTVTV
jgi:hypothetical protein